MKKRQTAALLSFFLGGIGGQYFYLGDVGKGILCVLFCWTFIPIIIGFYCSGKFIQMSDDEFDMLFNQKTKVVQKQDRNSQRDNDAESPNSVAGTRRAMPSENNQKDAKLSQIIGGAFRSMSAGKRAFAYIMMAMVVILVGTCSIGIFYELHESEEQVAVQNNWPNYTIIQEDKIKGIKYSVDLEIAKEIYEYEIVGIFNAIKGRNQGYERYFVHFYLPDMKVGSGAWATANYSSGELKVSILGLTAKAVNEAQAKNHDNSIGVWKNNLYGSIVHLVKRGDSFVFLEEFEDGVLEEPVIRDGWKFFIPTSPTGDFYYLVGKYLEVWDEEGIIARFDVIKEPDYSAFD